MSVHGRSNTKTLDDFEHKQVMTIKIDNKYLHKNKYAG